MKTNRSLPPQWLDRLLSWFCKEEVLENIQGDLHEVYQKRVILLGHRKANLLYFRDVLSILRPRLVKKTEGTHQLNQYGIFKNHLKTSIRSIKHNALFSGINVAGLAVSMSVGILMIMLLSELNSFDNFHVKKDRIFRVTTSRKVLFQGESNFFASAPHYIADQIEGQVAGVEQVLVLDRDLTADLKTADKGIAIKGYYATANFFDVLSFKLKKGNPKTALETPGAIVLTESAAKKLFGDSDPVNTTVTVDNNPDFRIGTITGIVEDPPVNSHIDYEALVSMKTVDNSLVERRRNRRNPGQYAQSYVYLVLKEGASVTDIEASMAKMMADHNSHAAPNTLSLQPMEEFVTIDAGLQPGPTFSQQKINMMIALTLIVLLSACFNYTNLSLVRGLRRSKEICVRKITGAKRFQVFSQFMTEAILVSLFALIAGIGLFFLIKPEFLSLPHLTGNRAMFLLDINPVQICYFLLFAIVVGCIAGFFPALILSKLKASALFNDASKIKLFSGVSARQILITCQTALSIGLVMCAVMVYKQYKYALNYDLGYDTKNIVNITVKGDYIDLLDNEYAKMSEVAETSKSSVILGVRNLMPADAMSEDQSDTIMFGCNYIDSKYLDMHGFNLLAGKGFNGTSKEGNTQNNIIVNEQFLKALNLGAPEEAIGKHIWYFGGEEKLKIHGVVSDFISMSLDAEAPKAFGFLNRPTDENAILGLKIVSNDLLATMQALEKSYRKMDSVHPFEATFYNDQIAQTYEDSKATYSIICILAFLAISISTLGLLGMVVFTIETRMKEVSIRKVLGAGLTNLILLLSRNFLIMITIAAAIAIPTTRYLVDNLILNKFLYKSEIGVVEMLSGLVVVLLIGVVTVGWQVRTAAVQNPADLLRDE